MEGLTKFGVTTVVGCLGTDGIGRDMCALVAKTKGLNEQECLHTVIQAVIRFRFTR